MTKPTATEIITTDAIAMILAAGRGTRMKSEKTKVLHTVAGRPIIQWVVNAALQGGCNRIVTIVGHQKKAVAEFLQDTYPNTSTESTLSNSSVELVQQTQQKGTGHAVQCGLNALIHEPDDKIVVILSGDAPLFRASYVKKLVTACRQSAVGLALVSTQPNRPVEYGRLVRNTDGMLTEIVEHRDATEKQRQITEMNAGFYAVRLGLLRQCIAKLDNSNSQSEFYLTDIVRGATELVKQTNTTKDQGPVTIDIPFCDVCGINTRIDLAWIEDVAKQTILNEHMKNGVTIVDPTSTYIDVTVQGIGTDTRIGPNVSIRGNSRIGNSVSIDTGCVIIDSVVDSQAQIRPYSVIQNSQIGTAAQIGPFTHCRPNTSVGKSAKLGNFVETKNTHLQEGAKANHLAYLGDASVGAGANIGAGTITCNYDGFAKYRTTIEAGAFIGSDSQLIAPVTIGRDAYVGSGTTVTKDVPRSALALSRSKQVNVDNWADRFRKAQEKRNSDKRNSDKPE